MQKKIPSLILATSLFLFGCQSPENASTQPSPSTTDAPMRVARYYWPGQYWVDIADKKGWFTEAGLRVETFDANADYTASIKAVEEGTLDTQNFYLFDLVQSQLNGKDLIMALAADRSSGSDGIIARKGIDTPQKLKGKKIGLISNSNSEYMLFVFLRQHEMDVKDVTIVQASPENGPDLLKKGEIDAFISYEPYLSQSEAQGNIRLLDAADLPNVTMAGYAFRRDFIKERPQDVQAFVNVWHRTTQYIKNNSDEAYALIAEINGTTQQAVEDFAKLDTAFDLKDNVAVFSYSAGYDTLHGSIRQMTEFFETKGYDAGLIDSSEFIDPRFIHIIRDTFIQ